MVDTVRTLSALQALLADNTAGDISPQDIRDFLVSVFPPQFSGAYVYKSGTQAIGNSAETPLTFQVELYDTDNYADLGSDNDALVIPADGYYVVSGGVACTGGASASFLRVNSPVGTWSVDTGDPAFSPDGTVSSPPHFLSATNLVSASVFQAAGRTVSAGIPSFLSVHRVGQAPA